MIKVFNLTKYFFCVESNLKTEKSDVFHCCILPNANLVLDVNLLCAQKLQSEKGSLEGAGGLNSTKQNLGTLFHSCALRHVTHQTDDLRQNST